MADDLTPEQFEVLRLISEDGVEADLSDDQHKIADWLDEQGYTRGMGDDYDTDIFLTSAGKDALNQNDPQWWTGEYRRRQWKVEQARKGIEKEKIRAESYVAHLRQEMVKLENRIADEAINAQRRLADTAKEAANAEQDFREWVEAHKDRLEALDG